MNNSKDGRIILLTAAGGAYSKESACKAGNLGSVSSWRRDGRSWPVPSNTLMYESFEISICGVLDKAESFTWGSYWFSEMEIGWNESVSCWESSWVIQFQLYVLFLFQEYDQTCSMKTVEYWIRWYWDIYCSTELFLISFPQPDFSIKFNMISHPW